MFDKKMKCCNGSFIGHLFALAGMYVLTWGLIGSYNLSDVLKSPVFFGLFLLGIAKCSMAFEHKDGCNTNSKKR